MSRQYDLHLENARQYYDDGNYEAARAAAQHAIDAALPGEAGEAQLVLALSLRQLEFDDQAFQLLDELVKNSESPEALAEFALMRAERGLCDETCLSCAQKAIDESPDIASSYMALFWYYAAQNDYLTALQHLKRGIHRGADFSEARVFEMLRLWCQEACNSGNSKDAFALSSVVADLFNSFEFLILHARISEFSEQPRVAVTYYKKALAFLRPGPMRTDVLEAIARLAI